MMHADKEENKMLWSKITGRQGEKERDFSISLNRVIEHLFDILFRLKSKELIRQALKQKRQNSVPGRGNWDLERGARCKRDRGYPRGSHPQEDERVQDPAYKWREDPCIGGETLTTF